METAHFQDGNFALVLKLKLTRSEIDVPIQNNSFLLLLLVIVTSIATFASLVHLSELFEYISDLTRHSYHFVLGLLDWPFCGIKNCKFKHLVLFDTFGNVFVLF
jgi:hypothetical protein